MKNTVLVALLAAAMLSGCSIPTKATNSCPQVVIEYQATTIEANGNVAGYFFIKNNGRQEVVFAAEGEGDTLHGRIAATEERTAGSNGWRAYNPILEELSAPQEYISVRPGEAKRVKFDANGLFILGQSEPLTHYSIVVDSEAGCKYRSEAFNYSEK